MVMSGFRLEGRAGAGVEGVGAASVGANRLADKGRQIRNSPEFVFEHNSRKTLSSGETVIYNFLQPNCCQSAYILTMRIRAILFEQSQSSLHHTLPAPLHALHHTLTAPLHVCK